MEEKIKNIIAYQLGRKISNVTPEARLKEDLNADSLDAIELTMALENEFNISISDEDAEKLLTVGDVVAYIMQHCVKTV